MSDVRVSSTVEYLREKSRKFYHARKKRDPEAHFNKQRRNSKNWRARHKNKVRARSAVLYRANPSYYGAASKKSLRKLKVRIVESYGGSCPCGVTDLDLLTVDHVGGWGHEQRSLTKRNILHIVAEEGCPPRYRILCRNCNMRDQFTRRRLQGLCGGRAAVARESRERLKSETFRHYGGIRCSCCKHYESDTDVLTLDHTAPCRKGRDRKHSGWRLYTYLKRLGYPTGFSVMCFNCNWLKGIA